MKTKHFFFLLIMLLLPGIALSHPCECECVEKVASGSGFFSLSNVFLFAGVIVCCMGIVLLWVFFGIPVGLIKPILLIGGILSFIYGHMEWMSIPAGIYAFVSALFFGVFVIWIFSGAIDNGKWIRLVSFILFVIWSVIAISYNSTIIAFATILAFAFVVSSFEASTLLAGSLGIRHDGYSWGAISAGIGTILFYLLIHKLSLSWYPPEIFKTSALTVGGMAAGAGLIFNGFQFNNDNFIKYCGNQIMSVLFAVFIIFVGTHFDSVGLEKIGGTFIFLYIITKIVDLVSLVGDFFVGIVIIIMSGAGLIYLGSYIVEHAAFFGRFLFFV